jgi:hypothetical protein
MTEKVETLHAAGFLISEANGNRSRDNGILVTGQNLGAGTVLGKTVTAGTITGAAAAGNVGNGTIGSLTVGAGAKEGVYKITIVEPAANAGEFAVEDPQGRTVGNGTVAVAFTGEINFTLADGATDFSSGDQFNVTVSQTTAKYKILAPAGTDGSERAAAILLADVNATAADQLCAVVSRHAEVNGNELVYPGGITAAEKDLAIAQLEALGIMVRL